VVLTAKPQAVRVAGLGSATETASILDRTSLTTLDATRQAAHIAYWRAGIASLRELEGLVVELHDAFNSLLPIGLADLGLVDSEASLEALVGDPEREPISPYANPITGPRGRIPTNLSGGLKARGHPVGGTGLFQIAENYLQLTDRFPNRRAQVRAARIAISHSIGGPGNNNFVTLLERTDSRRRRDAVAQPRLHFESRQGRPNARARRSSTAPRRPSRPRPRSTCGQGAARRCTSRCSRSMGGACSRSSTASRRTPKRRRRSSPGSA